MTSDDPAQSEAAGLRDELIGGAPHRMSPMGFRYGSMAGWITALPRIVADLHEPGDAPISAPGFVLAGDPGHVTASDVAFVHKGRPPSGVQGQFAQLAPDLAVGFVPPSNRQRDAGDKVAPDPASGIPLPRIFYPWRRTAHGHRPGRPVIEVGGADVVPDFRLPMHDIFRRPGGRR